MQCYAIIITYTTDYQVLVYNLSISMSHALVQ